MSGNINLFGAARQDYVCGGGAMASRPRQPRAQEAATVLERVLRRSGLYPGVRAHLAMALWPRVVGPALAGVSEAVSLRQGTLTVRVEGSAWRAELHHLLPSILERMNTQLDAPLLKIKLVSGPVAHGAPPLPPAASRDDVADLSVEQVVERARAASRRRGR
jgi:predicted nucleic acid-binding Zn ribbon protein